MNVFIDTNLFLDFYRMGKDKLDELDKVFALHKYGRLKLWLPALLKNEFWRNRSKVVADNIRDIEKDYKPGLPHIFRQHDDIKEFNKAVAESNKIKNKIFSDIQEHFRTETLAADIVIKRIFEVATIIEADEETLKKGMLRYDLGNPPGKNKSYGDAVNWECLLREIPEGEDLYLITEDSDYKSPFIEGDMNEYMKHEWKTKKKSEPRMYARLSEFIKDHFPQATNLAGLEVELTIKDLEESPNFYTTHRVIEKLSKYKDLNQNQILKLMKIYFDNAQVGYIRHDQDVLDFGKKILEEYVAGKNEDNDKFAESFNQFIKDN
ncbi:TPA: PIN domain-containing protein [Klebsiella pneumoniae]|uniref:PIN domain-containing protein n=1 Tax=Enterobacter cloacae complex TaxID=354276 RepID=UPI001D40D57D|nr:PIN domain-containing protein [Enterobacter cloacae]MCE1480267.1 PIN domain-containing protein [Enterobacter hormaechei]HBX5317683.1 hypothetical protein [Klebsiella pneumoniae]HDH0729452.1 DUF4935 domain-containing protein [Klebsiella aerogenes]EKX4083350.1 DUF4935 domain-containing protein [Enterobacter cloacae]MDR9915119.1 PIN domain-containing protein [Enterobacter cloacae subsp. cloacae]